MSKNEPTLLNFFIQDRIGTRVQNGITHTEISVFKNFKMNIIGNVCFPEKGLNFLTLLANP